MAASEDGKLIFLAVNDCINVYNSAEFSSKTPPDPSTFFPFKPVKVLKPTSPQFQTILSRSGGYGLNFCFNHIRSGWLSKNQECLVAVGELGAILIWDIKNLDAEPILLGNQDFASTWGIAMNKNNSLLATSSNSHNITIFHYPSRQVVFTSAECRDKIHTHNIPSLDFSSCGRWLVSCSIDGSVALWSISDGGGKVTRMTLPSCKEWGWLVRFISPHQYDRSSKNPAKDQIIKSFYHSSVQEHLPASPEDFDEELYRNSQMTLERMGLIFGTEFEETENEMENESEIDNEGYSESEIESQADSELEDSPSVDQSSDESPQKQVRLAYQADSDLNPFESLRFLPVSEGSSFGHLAEGAGDFWPDSSDGDLGYNPYNSADDFSDYSGEDEAEAVEDEESENEDNVSFSSSSNESESSISRSFIPKLESHVVSRDIEEIHFKPNNIHNNKSLSESDPCPYDLVYCTAESIFIINPRTGRLKLSLPSLVLQSFHNQNARDAPIPGSFVENNLLMTHFLQNRLAMGEWIAELSLLVVIDCNGHLIILSLQDTNKEIIPQSILLPNTLHLPSKQIIGYTVLRRFDEEFGVKVHIYLICEDGTFRLYEIVKRHETF